MSAPSIKVDGYLQAPPAPSTETGLDLAMLRAYPAGRALDYGCAPDDVFKLQRRVEGGAGWVDVALLLARDNLARAAAADGAAGTAASFLLHASACFRLAQAALEERPAQRLDAYRRGVDAFAAAMALSGHGGARLAVDYRGAPHGAWLYLPPDAPAGGMPCVLVCGGADGWCEAFFNGVPAFLARGLAVCLLELPGQGLARLQHGSFLDAGFGAMVSATLDTLAARGLASRGFGIIGHSLGGSLALRAAAQDARIGACCTNGGALDMREGLDKFPRALQRVARMLGDTCGAADVHRFMAALDLESAVAAMTTPVLCLQGGQDVLVGDAQAMRLLALCRAGQVSYEYWPEGVHCLYDHAAERNALAAAWFARQLGARGTGPGA